MSDSDKPKRRPLGGMPLKEIGFTVACGYAFAFGVHGLGMAEAASDLIGCGLVLLGSAWLLWGRCQDHVIYPVFGGGVLLVSSGAWLALAPFGVFSNLVTVFALPAVSIACMLLFFHRRLLQRRKAAADSSAWRGRWPGA